MNNLVRIGNVAPELILSKWVQGSSVNLHQFLGHVVLIEVFQVNCPGCFLYSLPQAVDLFQRYTKDGLVVLAVATAFEDFDQNNLKNLELLIDEGKVIGETFKALDAEKRLNNGLLPFHIPFPVGMDCITGENKVVSEHEVRSYIDEQIPDFMYFNKNNKKFFEEKALEILKYKSMKAETFNLYGLKGTPSHIVVDKKGILRAIELGQFSDLEWLITSLFQEK